MLEPLVKALAALRITPNMVTLFVARAGAAGAAVAAGFGWFALACAARHAGVAVRPRRRRCSRAARGRRVRRGRGRRRRRRSLHRVPLPRGRRRLLPHALDRPRARAGRAARQLHGQLHHGQGRGDVRRRRRAARCGAPSAPSTCSSAPGSRRSRASLFAGSPSHALRELPILVALSLVAVVTNVSAVQRFVGHRGRAARARRADAQPASSSGDAGIARSPTPAGEPDLVRVRPPAARRRSRALWQWVRHHVAAIAATVVDYGLMVGLRRGLAHLRPVPATAIGALAGAVTNFTLGRVFTYRATDVRPGRRPGATPSSRRRSLGLNAAGEYLFTTCSACSTWWRASSPP